MAGTHGKTHDHGHDCPSAAAGGHRLRLHHRRRRARPLAMRPPAAQPSLCWKPTNTITCFWVCSPQIAVVTNVEWDHPDCYPTPASFRRAFMQFTDAVERRRHDHLLRRRRRRRAGARLRTLTRARAGSLYGLSRRAPTCAPSTSGRWPAKGLAAELVWWHAPAGSLAIGSAPACTTCATPWRRWPCGGKLRRADRGGAGGAGGLSRLGAALRVEGRGRRRHGDRRLRPPPDRDRGHVGRRARSAIRIGASGPSSSRTPSAARERMLYRMGESFRTTADEVIVTTSMPRARWTTAA